MKLIIIYVLLNVLISILLERSKTKYKAATAVHAAAFTVVLFMLTASQPSGIIPGAAVALFGEEGYEALRTMMSADELGVLSPVVLLEMLMPILAVSISAILTAKAVEYVYNKKPPLLLRHFHKKRLFKRADDRSPVVNRIYLVNCVMRC